MKINFAQLLPHLNSKRQLYPIYLISGDESLLVDEAKNIIYQFAAKYEFSYREILHLAPNFDWQNFTRLAYNLSLFATKQIIELHLTQTKPNEAGSKMLIEYAARLPQDNILLLIAPKLDAAMQKSKWFKAIEPTGLVIQVWPLDQKQTLNWITNTANLFGISISQNAAKMIAEYTQGNLLATKQEIEKMSLLYGKGTLADEKIIAALSDNAHFNVFDLIDAIYMQDKRKIINVLEHLRNEGAEPTLILWAITRALRLLINCKDVARDFAALNQILNSTANRLKPEHKTQIKQLLPKLKMQNLTLALQKAAGIDQIIKGVKDGDVWQELTHLSISPSHFGFPLC